MFARDDVIFNGEGTLSIHSAKHGIVGKDDIKLTGGSITITAQNRGIDANDSMRIADGNLTIISGKEAIRAKNEDDPEKGYVLIMDGTLNLAAGGGAENGMAHTDDMFWGRGRRNNPTAALEQNSDSAKGLKATGSVILAGGEIIINASDDTIHSDTSVTIYDGTKLTLSSGDDAIHSDDNLMIDGGDIRILTSYEGLEAAVLTVNGGTISLVASDDGLNSSGGKDGSGWGRNDMFANDGSSITINGGALYVNAAGDGIDSNGDLIVNGGVVVVSGPTNSMNGALDANDSMTVNGGTIIAAGAVGMAETFGASSTQVSFLTNLSGGENSAITVMDENGKMLLSATVEKAFSCVVVSSPELQVGKTYTVSSGTSRDDGFGSSFGGPGRR